MSVDEETKEVNDFSYKVFGPTFMIAFLEGLGEIVVGSKVRSLSSISADSVLEAIGVYEVTDIYREVEVSEYVNFLSPYINDVMDSFGILAKKMGLVYFETPEGLADFSVEKQEVQGFLELSKDAKVDCIEEVIEKDIRPYVELDEGGVRVKDITKSGVVMIQYGGNCTTCHAASSTTLSAITSILKAKVHSFDRSAPLFRIKVVIDS